MKLRQTWLATVVVALMMAALAGVARAQVGFLIRDDCVAEVTAPVSGKTLCLDSTALHAYVNSAWGSYGLGVAFPLTANVSAGGYKIQNLAPNTAPGDALSQSQSHLNDLAAATAAYSMGGNKLQSVAGGATSGDALSYLQAGAALDGLGLDGAALTNAGGITSLGPTSITGTSSTGTDVINNANVNGVLNIRDWGASGSIQTATCTATANSSTLTGCTGGDFKVGQTIRIPSVGVSPTIAAPGAPTLTCAVVNGASCTGSVVYGYEIVAVQGYPNGPMTAAGPAQTITQAAQSPFGSGTQAIPNVYTTVAWSAVTNASLYVIYKSVAGGPYNFYTAIEGTSFNDSGDLQQLGFTCTDDGFPCTAPTTPTPNDVFAQITGISGGTYTTGPLTLPPEYYSQSGLPAATFPSQPSISGTVTITHDDTPAFQAIYNYLIGLSSPGHVKIQIPTGDYNVYSADAYGGQRVFNIMGLSDVTVEGDGWGSKIHQVGGRTLGLSDNFVWSPCGSPTHEPAPTNPNYRCGGVGLPGTAYALTDPATLGANTITLATPANASNFSPGEYVSIYTNATTYPGTDYQELNRITSVNSTSGVLGLQSPLSKPYSATLPFPYSECSTCDGAPLIRPLPYGPVATNIAFRNFWYEGAAHFLNYNTVWGLRVDHVYAHSDDFNEDGLGRYKELTNNRVIDESSIMVGASLSTGTAGDADIIVANNHYTALNNQSEQLCQEETSDVNWHDNDIKVTGTGGVGNSIGAFLGTLGCFGLTFTHNNMLFGQTAIGHVFAFSTPTTGSVTHNNIQVDSIGYASGSMDGMISPITPSDNGLVSVKDNIFNPIVNNGGNLLQIGGMSTEQQLSTITSTTTSGAIGLYDYIGAASIISVPMSGNISSINLGSQRFAGLRFAVSFVQPSTGGPYTLPAGTSQTYWNTAGNNVDFLGGVAPTANPTAGSTTTIWFYDDGTTVHEISRNYLGLPTTSAYALTSAVNGTSGGIQIYSDYGTYSTFNLTPTGNVTSINLGGTRVAGYQFTFNFIQPATGGPYTLPPDTSTSSWVTGGNAVSFSGNTPLVATTTAGTVTSITFMDDGSTIHEISRMSSEPLNIINACKGNVTLASGAGTFTNACVTTASVCSCPHDVTTPANSPQCYTGAPAAGSVPVTIPGGASTDTVQVVCQ